MWDGETQREVFGRKESCSYEKRQRERENRERTSIDTISREGGGGQKPANVSWMGALLPEFNLNSISLEGVGRVFLQAEVGAGVR